MTKHSIKRARERASLNRSAASKLFYFAYLMGRTSESMPYRERKYLEDRSSDDKVAIYYNGYCFIYSMDGVCITMFHAPQWFLNKAYHDGKVNVKNPKRYYAKYAASV